MSQDGSNTSAVDPDRHEVPSHDVPVGGYRPCELPSPMRLLCVGRREPNWIGLTLRLDNEGCREPLFRWVSTSSEALALLRDESFDCILVTHDTNASPAEPAFPTLPFLRGLRASGYDDAVLIVASTLDEQRDADIFQENCDVLCAPGLWESASLAAAIVRSVTRVELYRENHRLAVANHRRLVRERDETEHLLNQQRQMISDLNSLADSNRPDPGGDADTSAKEAKPIQPGHARERMPSQWDDYYHELLRTYVIMGSGSLGPEIGRVGELMAVAGLAPREALQLHLDRVETLVRGLGSRSARHVIARADLLALELMIRLAECYQQAESKSARERPQRGSGTSTSGPHDPARESIDPPSAVAELRQRVKRLGAQADA